MLSGMGIHWNYQFFLKKIILEMLTVNQLLMSIASASKP
jgi:hypothetical protein